MTALRFTRLRARLVPWLVLLLLLGQGLRLCIPAQAHEHESHPVHLESMFTTVADQHEADSSGDVDLPLTLMLKVFDVNVTFGALLVFVFVLLLAPQSAPRPRSGAFVFRPPRGHGFTPPSRAPPR